MDFSKRLRERNGDARGEQTRGYRNPVDYTVLIYRCRENEDSHVKLAGAQWATPIMDRWKTHKQAHTWLGGFAGDALVLVGVVLHHAHRAVPLAALGRRAAERSASPVSRGSSCRSRFGSCVNVHVCARELVCKRSHRVTAHKRPTADRSREDEDF